MKIQGENTIPADVQTVWSGLNDPEVLRKSIPGCESLEKVGENAFKATVVTRIGPVSTRFEGEVTLADLNPPHSYTLKGAGSAGPAGNASGEARVQLTALPDGGTKLTYDVDANLSGKIAQLGARLIQGAASMIAGQFFSRFAAVVSGQADGAAAGGKGAGALGYVAVGAVVLVAACVAYYFLAAS
ncbi:MAG: carbon monoxide dehydrogenase subunit G [Neomegalonema sp.]|nr:carbon monoxide dehydrogenase subunit G [Neomegalonema sp.]